MENRLHFGVGDHAFEAQISSEPFIPPADDDLMLRCDADNTVLVYKAAQGSMHPDPSKESQDALKIIRSMHPFDLKSGDILYIRLTLKEPSIEH